MNTFSNKYNFDYNLEHNWWLLVLLSPYLTIFAIARYLDAMFYTCWFSPILFFYVMYYLIFRANELSSIAKKPGDFEKAIKISKTNGATGISIFTADGLNDEQKSVLVKLKNSSN